MGSLSIGLVSIQIPLNDSCGQLQSGASRRHLQCLEIKLLKALVVDPGLQFVPEFSRQGGGECRFF